jgi:hypothetical protein
MAGDVEAGQFLELQLVVRLSHPAAKTVAKQHNIENLYLKI